MTRITKLLALITLTVLFHGCSYTPEATTVQPASEVGGTGDLKYSHESLGNNKHLLTVTAAPV